MNQDKNRGFTLVELMIAMGFVATLLLAIAMTVLQIGNIYNRGLTLKGVNQAGRSLAGELQRGIASSTLFSGNGSNTEFINKPYLGGRLCTGQYSYIWNYSKAIDKATTNNSVFDLYNLYAGQTTPSNPINFVKVIDHGATYCSGTTLKNVVEADSTELLDVGQHNLAIHYFNISADDSAGDSRTGQQLYSIEFIIGTNDQSALAETKTSDPSTTVCIAPGVFGSDPSYCSVNQFDIVVRAGSAAKEED